MFTVTYCETLPPEFDTLFEQSLAAMQTGTFDWGLIGNPETDEAKKQAVRELFLLFVNTSTTRVSYWEKDGHPIELSAGRVDPNDPDYIIFELVLYGADANGSRSWMHEDEYMEQQRDYIRDVLSFVGYKAACVRHGGVHQYQTSRTTSSNLYTLSAEDTSDNVVTLKFTYL
jgi:hypothetical protein